MEFGKLYGSTLTSDTWPVVCQTCS